MSDDVAENDLAWVEACRREEAIRDLLRRYPNRLTVSAVEDVAWELGLTGCGNSLNEAVIFLFSGLRDRNIVVRSSISGRPVADFTAAGQSPGLVRYLLNPVRGRIGLTM